MRTSMIKQTLLVATLAGLTNVASAALLGLDQDGMITSGDKVFSNFGWNGPTMTVTAIGNGTDNNLYGIQLQGALAQVGVGAQDYELTYKVTVNGPYLIHDIYEYANLDVYGAGFVDVSEDALNAPSGTVVAHGGVSSFQWPSYQTAQMNLTVPPLKTLWITKDVLVDVGSGGGAAVLTVIGQRFSQVPVPEPTTVLAGLGALALVLWGARKRS